MKNEFNNRLTSFTTTLAFLDMAGNTGIWLNQKPLMFGSKVSGARSMVEALREFCRQQGVLTTGAAEDKAREEAECETAGFEVGSAAAEFFRDHGDATNAAKVEFAESQWRRWSGEELLGHARTVAQLAQSIVGNAAAASYGIDAAAVARVTKEANDYGLLVNAPATAISSRAVLTRDLRNRFRAVDVIFDSMDRLVVQFGSASLFVAGYFNARQVIDRGHGPAPKPAPTPAPTPAP